MTAPFLRSPTPAPPCRHPSSQSCVHQLGAGTLVTHVCHLGVTVNNITEFGGSCLAPRLGRPKKPKAKTGDNSSDPPTGPAARLRGPSRPPCSAPPQVPASNTLPPGSRPATPLGSRCTRHRRAFSDLTLAVKAEAMPTVSVVQPDPH